MDDALDEANETFVVTLSNPSNATLGATSIHTYTITDNDPTPTVTLSLSGSPMAEAAGAATVTATLSAPSGQDVTVNLAYSGTATVTTDYTQSGTAILIPAGSTDGTVTFTAVQDTADELDETIIVDISGVTNATESGTQQVTATINDDDASPLVSFATATSSGSESTTAVTVPVSLSSASGLTVSVDYAVTGGTASGSGVDYTLASGTLTFAPGVATQNISITVVNDTTDEDDKTIQIALSNSTNATLGAIATHTYTILDNDPTPSLSINNVTVTEGNSGTTNASFTVTLSGASAKPVTVDYATANGTATAPADYIAQPTTVLTFSPGQTNKTISVVVNSDTIDEANETFTVTLSNPANATLGSATGTATITDDDGPSISINDASVVEGNGGTTNAVFTVSLSAASFQTITVAYATADNTASSSDYVPKSGTLTFPPGTTNQTITVGVTGDSNAELDETFFVNLSIPANATITDGQGIGTIRSDDFVVALEGQSFGDPTWFGGPLLGWKERDYVPLRLYFSGGPVTNLTYTIYFDHSNNSGEIPGIRDLVNWTNTSNITFTSGPTLNAPAGAAEWSYSFTLNHTASGDGIVWFWGRVAAGAHLYPGASLHVSGDQGLGVLQIHKPGAEPGSPDLAVTKLGPAFANAGQLINYVLNYTNDVATGTATGVELSDTLPVGITFVSCSDGCSVLGNTIIWDLGDVPRGASGSVSYQVMVANSFVSGSTFENYALIVSAENDSNFADNSDSVVTTIAIGCVVPTIDGQPENVTPCAGQPASFTVLANGSTLGYQWRKNGSPIAGATNSTYTIASVSGANTGSYDVVVSNPCGSLTSTAASLSLAAPTTASGPSDLILCPGQSATFSTTASGVAPFSYQWRKDGVDIPGATGETFSLVSVAAADAGTYCVVVSGGCDSVTNCASLTVEVSTSASAPNPVTAVSYTHLTLPTILRV